MSLLLLFRAVKKAIKRGGKSLFNFLLPLNIYLKTIQSTARVYKPGVELDVTLAMIPAETVVYKPRVVLATPEQADGSLEYELDEIITLLMAA
jgi:hypothetical protein